MTETTPTLLAARDALAKALLSVKHPDNPDAPLPMVRAGCAGILADALLASGVVRDVATLAADEALVERVTSALCDEWPGGAGLTDFTRLALTALAAALGGDQPAPTTEEQP